MPSMPDAIPVKNTTTEVIPAFGLMRRVDVNDDGVLTVAKPDTDGQVVLVNGPTAIPPSTYGNATAQGQGTYNPRVLIAYDNTDGTPANGETWGAKSGDWLARKNQPGFIIDGGAGKGVVNAIRWQDNSSPWKGTVRAATNANGTLTSAFYNGQVIDGVTLVTGDLILIKNQTSGAQNGIYVVPAVTGETPTRALGANGGRFLVGAVVFVSEGVVNKDTIWECTTDAPITIDSTSLSWTRAIPNAWKTVARCATTTNGTLSSAYANSSTVDGVTLATGDRILIKDQSGASENGIYVVQASGSPIRASDAWSGTELVGATVWVSEGTTNGNTIWACTTDAPITVNSTSLDWSKVYPSSSVSCWKSPPVRCATTVAGTLSSDYENGDVVDGVTLVTGDRILIKNQSTGSQNGIYTVNASGSPTRATDADTGDEMYGATVFVSEGTVNKDTYWTCTNNHTVASPIIIGTTSLVFAQTPSAGLLISGYVNTTTQSFTGVKTFIGHPTNSSPPQIVINTTATAANLVISPFISGASSGSWTFATGTTGSPPTAIDPSISVVAADGTSGGLSYSYVDIKNTGFPILVWNYGAFTSSGIYCADIYSQTTYVDSNYGFAVYDTAGPTTTYGISGTRTVKDGTGTNQTVTIKCGIITGWT